LHQLADLPRFHALHNQYLGDYRLRHRLRSRSHPVPDLAQDGDWLEAPFWAWRDDAPQRSRLFVRRRGDILDLRSGDEPWPSVRAGGAPELPGPPYKIRPRALTTTLFARVFLGDLFIHGIGGAKYDELTDEILRAYYGIEPPGYLVLSGTLRLPLPHFQEATEVHRRDRLRGLRDLRFNPERHPFADHLGIDALVAEKKAWIERPATTRRARRERCQALHELVRRIWPLTERERKRLEHDLDWLDIKLRINAVLTRRDYAFCLFPESLLRPFCTRFLQSEQGDRPL
jgi:hypothetical protein